MAKFSLFPVVFLCFACFNLMHAHEVRPAYLQIKQIDSIHYEILWKIPRLGDAAPKIYPVFPEFMEVVPTGVPEVLKGSLRQTFTGTANSSIQGEYIRVDGLSKTLIDVLVHMEFIDGTTYSVLLQPDNPRAKIPIESGLGQVATTYVKLGIEHILFGVDHLLFVLALLLITKGFSRIVKTITAFTIAHSITLSLSALGLIGFPSGPVEALIALSILFLAVELVHYHKGKKGLTVRYPWVIAFIFGLLHGFGFAGALMEIGLPQSAIPVSLLFFNLGVEIGQLIFIAIMLGVVWNLVKLIPMPKWSLKIPSYSIGGIAAFWLIDRILVLI